MRLIFIPGFGEDPSIFDKIHPAVKGNKVFLNNWVLLGEHPRPDLNALHYAAELVNRFNICLEDIIIGHSMGGWTACHIKHLTGCPIVQIASWTDQQKVGSIVKNCHLLF